ncbi:MAG: thioredoxin domain-containing protein [candidate division Zixibacteria bacterium]|nr:thioredoxin domain-containing protein [candidate division Zixibacteria bacterium]
MESPARTSHNSTNHLISENSPYLLAHAHNPVDWYPWGDEALKKAEREDKLIFLSIGYAACHWCHVMEHESFENDEIAAILNEHYVSIKVDREQRPDLDEIYMAFTTSMTGHGGWPMSVFLTPDRKPVFAGTYFPPDDRFGRPGFKKVITEIAAAYRQDKGLIKQSAADIFTKVTEIINRKVPPTLLSRQMPAAAAEGLMKNFDNYNGGFGNAPKFPHALELSLFLRHYRKTGDLSFLQAAEKALTAMAHGGIFDQVGGGFARYATDARWLVPHFEKMLYDNALLAPVYIEAYQITGNEFYLDITRRTLDFILREMTDKAGGFYSALDADSEGKEGKFYVWSKREIEEILGGDSDRFIKYFNVTEQGNFEGYNILNVDAGSERIRQESGITDFDAYIGDGLSRLLEARSRRVRPLTDDKILASWNGLALSAFCRGYQVTGDGRYLDAAVRNASSVHEELYRDGKMAHSFRSGRRSSGQFLEDYAYYIQGLIELYQTDHENNGRWLAFATELAETAQALFMDDGGHFYLRPSGQDDLIFRPGNETDGALPAPGSVMIANLLKLNRITENQTYLASAEKALKALSGLFSRAPGGMTAGVLALDYYFSDKIEIVIVGEGETKRAMVDEIHKRFLPNKVIAVSCSGDEAGGPLFVGRRAEGGEVLAFVCRNSVCNLPASTLEELQAQLSDI